LKPVALFYAGFFVELRYVGLACFDLNIERVAQRVAKGGHAIDAQTIERRYKTSLANLPIALQWVDEASIWDNSYEVPQLHLVVSPSSVTVLQAKQPGWINEVFGTIKVGRQVHYETPL
jgi:predicted ABC-type ATPase